jgi:hypothetical protein
VNTAAEEPLLWVQVVVVRAVAAVGLPKFGAAAVVEHWAEALTVLLQ